MDIKEYIGKKIKVIEPISDGVNVFNLDDGRKQIEVLVWNDDGANFAALNLVVKDRLIQEIYRESFCWMCPEGKSHEKRISKFADKKAEIYAEKSLKKLLV